MTFLDWVTSGRAEVAIAGLAGAAVSAALEWTGWTSFTRKVFVGFVTAYYTAPVGQPLIKWAFGHFITISEEHSASAGGFVMGVGGIVIAEIIVKAWRLRRDELRSEATDDKA